MKFVISTEFSMTECQVIEKEDRRHSLGAMLVDIHHRYTTMAKSLGLPRCAYILNAS